MSGAGRHHGGADGIDLGQTRSPERLIPGDVDSLTGDAWVLDNASDAFDNLGYLERAPSPEIRQRIIDGRINHLETEIRGFQDQIDKLLGGS